MSNSSMHQCITDDTVYHCATLQLEYPEQDYYYILLLDYNLGMTELYQLKIPIQI
jgi:hypothetical protein